MPATASTVNPVMSNRELTLVLLLLAAAAPDGDGRSPRRPGLASRMAARATGRVVEAVDLDTVLAGIDVDALMARVDVEALLDRIDVNALLDRVDVNALLDRVDVEALLERVDVDRLMDRVDVDRLLERADIEGIVRRSGVPDIVRESTEALAGSALDVVRRQLVSVDVILSRMAYRLTGRSNVRRPPAPPAIESAGLVEGGITGHYAGPLTRLFAFVLDALIVWFVFFLTVAGVGFVANLFSEDTTSGSPLLGTVLLIAFVIWAFVYLAAGLAIAGRTIGMGFIGVLVVTRSGNPIRGRTAAVRALVYPLSLLPLGLGFLGILVGRERRALHDVIAGTAVVYDWGDRPAELRAPLQAWLDRHRPEATADGP
jgi:uncharacterized RDD family membrane protein YckC